MPEQAVILCGGMGTRLRPLTDSLPKPMAPVNGRPFLEYLIQQLREQGVQRIVLLTGYRGESIREHFGDGTAAGVAISYSHGPAEWETGRRLWEAGALLEPHFMLLYSDNYAPVSCRQLWALHEGTQAAITLALQPKAKANVRLGADGFVELYDPSRTANDLAFVEIGYMMVTRDRLLAAIDRDASLSVTLTALSERRELSGLACGEFYHSISDLERLQLAERYLAFKKILLIDRDGTINKRPARAQYVTDWDQFHWIDSTVEAMRQLAAEGFRFIVISNQAGIARGMLSRSGVDAINAQMCTELRKEGIEVLAKYVCPHHWDDGCNCRKPAPGMFYRASADHAVRLNRTIYIGDDPRDTLAARNAGCESALVGPGRDEHIPGSDGPDCAADSLTELVPWIISRFDTWASVA